MLIYYQRKILYILANKPADKFKRTGCRFQPNRLKSGEQTRHLILRRRFFLYIYLIKRPYYQCTHGYCYKHLRLQIRNFENMAISKCVNTIPFFPQRLNIFMPQLLPQYGSCKTPIIQCIPLPRKRKKRKRTKASVFTHSFLLVQASQAISIIRDGQFLQESINFY